MTRKDLEFYYMDGKPPYPITITNEWGHPEGIQYPDGTFLPVAPSNVGKRDNVGEVVWDGCQTNPYDNTKGRLLPFDGPPYYDSTRIFEYLATANEAEDDAQDDAQKKGTGKSQSRTKKRNRKTRTEETQATKKAA